MKQTVGKYWHWIVTLAIFAGFFYYFDKRSNDAENVAIEEAKKVYDSQILELGTEIDSLKLELEGSGEKLERLNYLYRGVQSEVLKIKDERSKVDNTVNGYTDSQLDSILSNYRRPQ